MRSIAGAGRDSAPCLICAWETREMSQMFGKKRPRRSGAKHIETVFGRLASSAVGSGERSASGTDLGRLRGLKRPSLRRRGGPRHNWDAVLSTVTGTIYRGTERISSNALLNLLEVGPDPVIRQKVAKR